MIAYSQRDDRWSHDIVGKGEYTIGQVGCLITAAAAMLDDFGSHVDPGRLNENLTRTWGYAGDDNDELRFVSLQPWGVRFTELILCPNDPAPVDRLIAAVGAGAGLLAEVDFYPGGKIQQHWVLIRTLSETDGHIMDPWQLPGEEEITLGRYLAEGWNSAAGIMRAALYSANYDRMVTTPITNGPRQSYLRVWRE